MVDALSVATPPLRVFVPSVVEPTRNVTLPVGVPLPGESGLTVTSKVMGSPTTGLGVGLAMPVVVLSSLTVTPRPDEVTEASKFGSPP